MAAPFEIILPGVEDEKYAAQIAQTCFNEIDRIESEISRWNPSSETGLVNALKKNESTTVSIDCFTCLQIGKKMYKATEGLFDITIGPLLHSWLTKDYKPRTPTEIELKRARAATGCHLLKLDPERIEVTVLADGMKIDLGGIGKGYALDMIAQKLREEFEIQHFLLNAGDSTVYAEGKDWQLGAGGQKIALDGQSLSGSSIMVKGQHIIDPRSGKPLNLKRERAWAIAPTAAASDALSTALMLMTPAQITACCTNNLGFGAKTRSVHKSDQTFGVWPSA